MDQYLTETFNALTGHSLAFDLFLDFIQETYLVKGLFAVGILVAVFSAQTDDGAARRNNVYATLMLVFIALFIARIMQMTLPFSPRPLHTEGMDLTLIAGLNENVLENDSSFPSDHAVMFMTMAVSVLMYARVAGLVLLTHAIFVICLPRLILGFHWASDLLAGALIGVALALLLHRRLAGWLSRTGLDSFRERHPSTFYFLFFAILCETATLYRGSRHIISHLGESVKLLS